HERRLEFGDRDRIDGLGQSLVEPIRGVAPALSVRVPRPIAGRTDVTQCVGGGVLPKRRSERSSLREGLPFRAATAALCLSFARYLRRSLCLLSPATWFCPPPSRALTRGRFGLTAAWPDAPSNLRSGIPCSASNTLTRLPASSPNRT